MPSELLNLGQIDFWQVFVGVVIILAAIKLVQGLASWVFEKLGLEFKWQREKKEDHELLSTTIQRVNELEEKIAKVDKHAYDADKRIEDALNNLVAAVEQISGVVDRLDERSVISEQASREALGDRINQRFRHYIAIGGIPEDELDEFSKIFNIYKKTGGNHSGEAKYKYCIEKLPILPPQAKLTYEEDKSNGC